MVKKIGESVEKKQSDEKQRNQRTTTSVNVNHMFKSSSDTGYSSDNPYSNSNIDTYTSTSSKTSEESTESSSNGYR